MYICPHCETRIEYLDYNVNINSTEYGTAYFNTENTENREERSFITDYDYNDQGDTEWNGRPEYQCPECNETIELNELIWQEEKREKETEKKITIEENPLAIARMATNKILYTNENGDKISKNTTKCPKCKYLFKGEEKIGYGETGLIENQTCPKCNKEYKIKK